MKIGSASSKALRSWLVGLYPAGWRERYAQEFELLLEQCLNSPLDVVDVILGALDARLQLLNGENVTWRLMNMLNKLRTTLLIVFAAFIGYIVAGMALVGLVDDSPMIPLMRANPAPALAWTVIQLSAVGSLLAIIIGGLPISITVIRRALTVERRNLGLLLVPVFSLIVLGLYFGFMFLVATGRIQMVGVVQAVQPGNFPLGNRLVLAGFGAVFVLGAIASTWAVWTAVSRTDVEHDTYRTAGRTLSLNIYRFAYAPAVVAAACMLLMLIATLTWGVLVFSALPGVFFGDYGLWQTSTQAWYYGILVVMGICCLAAILGIARSRSAMTTT